jgi:hypothetical protein
MAAFAPMRAWFPDSIPPGTLAPALYPHPLIIGVSIVTCWEFRQSGPILAAEWITIPFRCGNISPPSTRVFNGISAPVTIDPMRYRNAVIFLKKPIYLKSTGSLPLIDPETIKK